MYPAESGPRDLLFETPDRALSTLTHWSFGQLCSLASPGNPPASYFRDTNMPAPMIADCLTTGCGFPVLPVQGTVKDQPETRDRGVEAMI